MTSISVSELKAQLSKYLRQVKRGGEIQVLERGTPVARLVGVQSSAGDAHRLDWLVGAGIIRRGSGDLSWVLEHEPVVPSGADVSSALADDREDRL